jgi:hypothetical protein
MVTLSTALLAGSAALLGQAPIGPAFKLSGAILLMLCLGASLWGSLPREARIDTNRSDVIEAEHQRGIARKSASLQASYACLFLALGALVVGILLR